MQQPEVFVIAPLTSEWVPVLETVRRAVEEAGLKPVGVDTFPPGARLTTSILDRIRQADLIIADISRQNPNVLYELGFAHAFGKPTILLFDLKSDSGMPSTLQGFSSSAMTRQICEDYLTA
jgi:nucleoside 2-deoxyribosyltransferase